MPRQGTLAIIIIIIIIIVIIIIMIIIIIIVMIMIIASVPCLGIRGVYSDSIQMLMKHENFIIAISSQYLHIHYIIFLSLF